MKLRRLPACRGAEIAEFNELHPTDSEMSLLPAQCEYIAVPARSFAFLRTKETRQNAFRTGLVRCERRIGLFKKSAWHSKIGSSGRSCDESGVVFSPNFTYEEMRIDVNSCVWVTAETYQS